MFLIMTADQRFWRRTEPVLLLGQWCKTYDNRHEWTSIPHDVLPYHWDDRVKLENDFHYIDSLYERYLASLADALNDIHQTSHSLRYWRIVIGPWLALFLGILFDRYECLRVAARTKKVDSTLVGEYPPLAFLHRDIRSFYRWMGDLDDFNHFLFSRIVRHLGLVPHESIKVAGEPDTVGVAPRLASRRGVERALWNLSLRLPRRFTEFVFASSSLPSVDLVTLQLSLGQCPALIPPDIVSPDAWCDPSFRTRLSSALHATNEFEALSRLMVAEQIPSAYVENYATVRELAMAAYPRAPKLIFTSVAFGAFEGFKLWTAHHVDRGVPFVGTQHGCHYGTARWSETESHERRIYDRFFTWGWDASGDTKVLPLPAAKLNGATRVRPRRDGPLLLATAAWPPYFHRFTSVPVSSTGTLEHFEQQFTFARALPAEVRSRLLVRIFPNDRTWRQQARWADACPGVRCDLGDKKFLARLKESRLLICNASATTQLESFAANFPTVVFQDPRVFELRDEATPYFDLLIDAGIMQTTPEAAAALVADIWRDPMAWWTERHVQEARRIFTERFARTSPDWRREWRSTFRSLVMSTTACEQEAPATS